MQKAIKRIIDIIISIVILIIFLPLWIIVAILIKLTSPGPVLFLQDRPGLHKKIFKIYKFRTMRLGSEKMIKGQEVMKDDPRITTIGSLWLDIKIIFRTIGVVIFGEDKYIGKNLVDIHHCISMKK